MEDKREIQIYGSSHIKIPGVTVVADFYSFDDRGSFRKIYCSSKLEKLSFDAPMQECFISISRKNVIRGMHFQTPPSSCAKLITVLRGSVIDVICDLRKNSPAYLQTDAFLIPSGSRESVYIPDGCAHGFLALEDDTMMLYNTTAEYNPIADKGVHYTSIDFDWPVASKDVIVSERDSSMPSVQEFATPFYFTEEVSG